MSSKKAIDKQKKMVYNTNCKKGIHGFSALERVRLSARQVDNSDFREETVLLSSARNFLITFLVAALVFGGLAYFFYPKLAAMLPTAERTEESEEESEFSGLISTENSTTSGNIDISDPAEELRGSVGGLLIYKNDDGETVGVRYLRYNLDKEAVAYCDIPVSTTLYNDVGASVPLSDMFGMVSGARAAEMIVALTGCSADFYIVLKPDSLPDLIAGMSAPYYNLKTEIDYKNPKYEDVDLPIDSALPADYYRHVDAGRVGLNKETLEIILEYYRLSGDTQRMDSMLLGMYSMLMTQVVTEQKSVLAADYARAAGLLKRAETNITKEFLSEHAADLFRFNEYERKDIPYSGRTTIKAFKDFDR